MIERHLPAGPRHLVRVRCTDRFDGDFHVDGPAQPLADRRRALAAGEWTWLRQVHGAALVEVNEPGAASGAEADGSITDVEGAVLAIQTADCAPVVLASDRVVAVVHAGWRGIVGGVIPAAIDAVRRRTNGEIHALLGPCIEPSAYEFGNDDLDEVAAVVGDVARSTTTTGAPALDLPASVRAQCHAGGVASFERLHTGDAGDPADTSGERWYSYRTMGDSGRQVTVAWLERR